MKASLLLFMMALFAGCSTPSPDNKNATDTSSTMKQETADSSVTYQEPKPEMPSDHQAENPSEATGSSPSGAAATNSAGNSAHALEYYPIDKGALSDTAMESPLPH